MSVLLRVSGLEVAYGPVRAVRGVDLEVHEGEIRAILGANGMAGLIAMGSRQRNPVRIEGCCMCISAGRQP